MIRVPRVLDSADCADLLFTAEMQALSSVAGGLREQRFLCIYYQAFSNDGTSQQY